MVDVSHDRNDRRTRNEILFLVHLRIDCLLNLDGDEFDLEAELFGTITNASASSRWLIETISPRFMHTVITSLTLTSIMVANSLTVTNSVTFSTLFSCS